MSLSNLSLLPFLLGLAVIAAILGVLQFLRVRYQRVDVITTMFWREAIEESRARVLLRRFRHPWAYLFVLAIASLLWWAFAEPHSPGNDQREHLVLLDGSAAMLAGDRYTSAVEALTDQIDHLPKDQRRVFWCGRDHRLLLDRGEETLVLTERLRGRHPDKSPASVEAFLATHAKPETVVYVFGEAPLSSELLASLPESLTLRRVGDPEKLGQPLNNVGIATIGLGPAQSGRYDAVDVYVRVYASGTSPIPALVIEPLNVEGTPLGDQAWVFRDLPADGSTITARLLGEDDLAIDNDAQLALPLRESIRVEIADSLSPLLAPILSVDPAVSLVEETPDIVFGIEGTAVPSLQLVTRDTQEEAFMLSDQWPDAQAQAAVEEAFRGLGIDQIDATSLATSLATTIQLGASDSDIRQVLVWQDLFSKEYNLVQSAAFPLFIAKAVRWLADTRELVPYVAVGELNEALEIAGVSFAPSQPGSYETVSGDTVMASLVEPGRASPENEIETVVAMASSTSGRSWMTWVIIAVLILLLVEWGLIQKGSMP